jgi:hypothetical protein
MIFFLGIITLHKKHQLIGLHQKLKQLKMHLTHFISHMVTTLGCAGFVAAAFMLERAQRGNATTHRRARARASSLAVQLVTALVAMTAVLRDPMLLLLLLPILVAARAYYRARFGLSYPG